MPKKMQETMSYDHFNIIEDRADDLDPPLAHIFNIFLTTCVVPNIWKIAKVMHSFFNRQMDVLNLALEIV